MPLNGYQSMCEERQKKIVSSEQGRQHRANNPDKCSVTQYRIDGVVIRDGLRCDYLLMNEDKSDAYLIELKGTNIEHALEQLEATAQTLRQALQNYHMKYRLVHTRAKTHAIYSTEFKKFRQRHAEPGEFAHKENVLEESI